MSFMKAFWVASTAWVLAGCDFRLPAPRPGARAGGEGGAEGISVTVEPEAPFEAVPRAVRFRVEAGFPLDPGAIALVRGDVGPGQLRDIGDRDPSSALQERMVPSLSWTDGAGVVLAPTELLDPEERYTLAVGEARETLDVRVAPTDPAPLLRRIWPPAESASVEAFAIWCGDAPLPLIDAALTLSPGGPWGFVRRGAVDGGAGERCARFEVSPGAVGEGDSWLAPAFVTSSDGAMVSLEPVPLRAGGGVTPMPSLDCEADEIAFGPGCARFADDRLFARSPGTPLFWAVSGFGADAAIAVRSSDPFTITGLPPSTAVMLDVVAIDERGTRVRMLTSAVTEGPMPHVVLNEVLANPLGAEPVSEWVEIVNDGQAPASLEGHVLSDGGGETPLPGAILPPGGYALIVNEGFVEDNGVDPRPLPGTTILRVPHLGKNGLTNAGEPLVLRDAEGVEVSRFPASPKPKAGMSVARRAPSSPDGSPSSFAIAAPSPGEANAF